MPGHTYLTLRPEDAAALRERLDAQGTLVVALCAAWCGTCRGFETAFEAIADRHPEAIFVWLDVEDDADVAGDVDVENFPTLAVFRDGRPVHFGVTLPAQAARLVDALLQQSAAGGAVSVPDEVAALPDLLRSHASGH